MSDPPREPTPPPPPTQPQAAAPPPAGLSTEPAPTPEREKATGSLRALAVLLVFVLLFGAAVVAVVMVDIIDSPRCDEVGGVLAPTEDCYDLSSAARIITLALGWAAVGLGAIAGLAWLAVAVVGRPVRTAVIATIAAVVLAGLSLLIG